MAVYKKCESPNKIELPRHQNNIDFFFFSLSKTHNLKKKIVSPPINIYNIKIDIASNK